MIVNWGIRCGIEISTFDLMYVALYAVISDPITAEKYGKVLLYTLVL